jgi:hypothetical protein
VVGRVVLDKPRHKENMHLPLDYPRLTSPEWFVAEPGAAYFVTDYGLGKTPTWRRKRWRPAFRRAWRRAAAYGG